MKKDNIKKYRSSSSRAIAANATIAVIFFIIFFLTVFLLFLATSCRLLKLLLHCYYYFRLWKHNDTTQRYGKGKWGMSTYTNLSGWAMHVLLEKDYYVKYRWKHTYERIEADTGASAHKETHLRRSPVTIFLCVRANSSLDFLECIHSTHNTAHGDKQQLKHKITLT